MAAFLRRIVAGPRAEHAETGLDLCYVTSNIIATSGPSQTYPQLAYRNPLERLVSFLDTKHEKNWAIWEFRAEGTGYPDEAVYGRIRHYPWPDHHPPPFRLVPLIVESMHQWLQGEGQTDRSDQDNPDDNQYDDDDTKLGKGANGFKAAKPSKDDTKQSRVVVVHCKAGKGRSGTMACSYLIAEGGWSSDEALARFTQRRMRPGFGNGITIPSQLRWIGYVERWARRGGKRYIDGLVEIVEIHVWGLRHGVKLAIEGYVDEGKKIHVFHTFGRDERFIVEGNPPGGGGLVDLVSDMAGVRSKGTSRADAAADSGNDSGSGSGDPAVAGAEKNTGRLQLQQQQRLKRPNTDDLLARNASLGAKPRSEASQDILLLPPADRMKSQTSSALASSEPLPTEQPAGKPTFRFAAQDEPGGQVVIFKSKEPIRIPNSDVNVAIERRNRTAPNIMGLTMVTSVAHVWFNTYFEGNGPEQDGRPDENGVFVVDWEQLDGIKGSSQKGSRAADRLAVVWRRAEPVGVPEAEAEAAEKGRIAQPDVIESAAATATAFAPGKIPQMRPADWRGGNREDPEANKSLGLRRQDPDSAEVSRASSVKDEPVGDKGRNSSNDALKGVKASGPEGEDLADGEDGN